MVFPMTAALSARRLPNEQLAGSARCPQRAADVRWTFIKLQPRGHRGASPIFFWSHGSR